MNKIVESIKLNNKDAKSALLITKTGELTIVAGGTVILKKSEVEKLLKFLMMTIY